MLNDIHGSGVLVWVEDDGGRAAAGYKGTTGDCVTRALAIVTGKPYQEIYDLVNAVAQTERPRIRRGKARTSNARTGVFKPTTKALMAKMGGVWTPCMKIGSGCKVHLRADELPSGKLAVQCSKHVVAVIDGVVHDLYDPSRGGTRCVYGYWRF